MAEELKRHGITFSLDLNKHPKNATNLSLINAENFKISEDGTSLISDKSLLENEIIKNKLNSYYRQQQYEITYCIPTNDEIILFVKSNYVTNTYYDLELFRYSEKLKICSNSIIPTEYPKMKYYGGKFSGTFTYNSKNELIIAFCEYDSILRTEFECGEPLKVINLGYWKNNILVFEEINLNPNTFPICPEIEIPVIYDDEIISGYSKKGWYHFYIRYKIDNHNYTKWYDFGKPFYLDDIKYNEIFNYSVGKIKIDGSYKDIDEQLIVKDIYSDEYEDCNKTIKFNLSGLDNNYEYYQIGFICSSKIYTIAKKSFDIDIKNTNLIVNYKLYENYDSNEFIKTYINYYNVKNIINYNNRIYISNYKLHNFNIINENIDYEFRYSEQNLLNDYITVYNKNNEPIKSNYVSTDEIPISILYPNKLIGYYEEKENIYDSRTNENWDNNYNETINFIYEYSRSNLITYCSIAIRTNDGNLHTNDYYILNSKYNMSLDSWIDTINTRYKNIANDITQIILQIKYKNANIDFSENVKTKITNNNELIYFNDNYKYYVFNKNKENGINNIFESDINGKYIAKIEKNTLYESFNAINWTLLPLQPYNFYIHYINKYGEISNGFPILDSKKYIKTYNNTDCIQLTYYVYNVLNEKIPIKFHIELFKKIYTDYQYVDINNLNIKYENIINTNIIHFDLPYADYIKSNVYKQIYINIFNYSNKDSFVCELIWLLGDNNIFISRNKNIALITTTYVNQNIINLLFKNINCPNGYKYFISYEKLENVNFIDSLYKNTDIIRDNEINSYTNVINNLYLNGKYLEIRHFSKENQLDSLYNYDLTNNDNLTTNTILNGNYKFTTDFDEKICQNIKLKLNLNNNIPKGYCNAYGLSGECIEHIDYIYNIVRIYDDHNNIYDNENKILLRCSQINNTSNVIINPTSHLDINSILLFNEEGVIMDGDNLLKCENNKFFYGTDDQNGKIRIPLKNYFYISYFNNFPKSKQLNNKPKIYYTLQTNPNELSEFKSNLIFLPKDNIDLYKNNSLDYDESVLSIYTNYNKNNINKIDFIKTIRRSAYIKDESLEIGWRTFESEAYQNIQENKGRITRIEGIGDLLLVHTSDSLFQFDKNNLLVTENKTVQLGQQDTFNVGYKEIFTSPLGYGGLQDKEAAIVGEFGYIWYNNDFNKLYQYDASSLNVISGNIEFLLNKYKPTKCRFVDDKYNKRLLIQFQLNNNQVLNLTYNYSIKAFISFYINEDSKNDLINETYNTKTKFYILENNKIFAGFDKSNAKKLSFIINENYTKIKRLNFIKYKLYKRIDSSNDKFDANLPVEGNALSIINNRRPYSGYKLKVYNDLCSTEELDIQTDHKENINDIKKPYYDLGNFTFNYLRDKETDSQIFGNFFIVEFIFDRNNEDIIEFESLEYGISYEEN